jgi:hypothetical protein
VSDDLRATLEASLAQPKTRPAQPHLKSVVSEHGSGDATDAVRKLLEYGLVRQREKERQQRIDEGKSIREYPYITDAGKCPRQVYFALTNTPETEELTLDSWMTLNLGNKAEELYIQLLEAAGVTILSQERVELEALGEKVVGKLDLLIEVPAEVRALIPGLDERELWEIKTKNSRALGWVIKKGGPEPGDSYVHQVNNYLHAANLNKIPRPTQARGRLIYTAVGATKGEPLFHAWFVPYDEAKATTDVTSLGLAMIAARQGSDPGIPPEYASDPAWPCLYCRWRSLCHGGKT